MLVDVLFSPLIIRPATSWEGRWQPEVGGLTPLSLASMPEASALMASNFTSKPRWNLVSSKDQGWENLRGRLFLRGRFSTRKHGIYIYIYSYIPADRDVHRPWKHTPYRVSCLFWKTVFWLLGRVFGFFWIMTASVHTLHMPKPVITFVFKALRNGLLRYILYTCSNLW